jgi:hypothetical protein
MKLRIAPLAGAGLIALAGLNAWLLPSVLGEIFDGNQPDAEDVEWHPRISTSADAATVRKPIESYPLTLAHPIFFKTREPFVPPPLRLLRPRQRSPTLPPSSRIPGWYWAAS